MPAPLIAIVGDISPDRPLDPAPKDTKNAKLAAEKIGTELARRGARLLVYGGPFLETDVVRGFVAGKPSADRSILMWYTQGNEPPAFAEEDKQPRLFERRPEFGKAMHVALFRIDQASDAPRIDSPKASTLTLLVDDVPLVWHLPLAGAVPPAVDPASGEKFPGGYFFNPYTGAPLKRP